GRRVEPARVVPTRDVRRVEELLAREAHQPGPGLRVDSAAEAAQHPGQVDGRRLHHPRPGVERRVAQDRGDYRGDLVATLDVQVLERALRPRLGRRRDEVAPELRDEERRVQPVMHAEPTRVAPVVATALAEHLLVPGVVALLVEAELDWAEVAAPR